MLWYIVKLIILLPLIGAMIWGSLKLTKHLQSKLGLAPTAARAVRIVETQMLSPTQKLAVLEFHGREILIAISRAGITRLAESPPRDRGEEG
jgi:flagellar protein FliO/FliZ